MEAEKNMDNIYNAAATRDDCIDIQKYDSSVSCIDSLLSRFFQDNGIKRIRMYIEDTRCFGKVFIASSGRHCYGRRART